MIGDRPAVTGRMQCEKLSSLVLANIPGAKGEFLEAEADIQTLREAGILEDDEVTAWADFVADQTYAEILADEVRAANERPN